MDLGIEERALSQTVRSLGLVRRWSVDHRPLYYPAKANFETCLTGAYIDAYPGLTFRALARKMGVSRRRVGDACAALGAWRVWAGG